MTFIVAYDYLNSERTDNFERALSKEKWLFAKDDVLPQVIVSDRDLSFMNASKIVFTSLTNLLCLFHITKNVNTKCKIHMDKAKAWKNVTYALELLLQSLDEESYNECLKSFTN